MAVIRTAKRCPYLAVGWLWYVGTLVPVIGIMQVGLQAGSDRYTYVPLIGISIMIAWGMPDLLNKSRFRKEALFVLSALSLSCLLIVSWIQVGYWQNSITLSDHALKVTTRNSIAHYNRGTAYLELGNYRQAIGDYDRTIQINPEAAEAYYNRGIARGKVDNYKQAVKDFDRAIELNHNYAEAYYNRAASYYKLGNPRQAFEDLKTAARYGDEDAKNFLRGQGINW